MKINNILLHTLTWQSLRNANLRLDTHKWLLTIKKTFFKNEMSLVHLTKFDIFFIFIFGFIYDFSLQGSRASNEITVSVFNWMTWSSDDCYKKNSTLLKFNSFHVHVVTPLILSVDTYFRFYCSFSSRIVCLLTILTWFTLCHQNQVHLV